MRGGMKYPFAPLAAVMGMSEAQACRQLNLAGKTAQKYRRDGMSELVADRMAVKAGFAPYEVWPEWLDEGLQAAQAAEEAAAEAKRAYQREWARKKYQEDAEHRAAKLAKAAQYRIEAREALRRQSARYRQANPEKVAAKRAAWYAANRERERATRRAYYLKNRETELARVKEYAARRRSEKNKDIIRHEIMSDSAKRDVKDANVVQENIGDDYKNEVANPQVAGYATVENCPVSRPSLSRTRESMVA